MKGFSKCCFCISLKNGGLIAAAWTLFTSVLMTVLQIMNIMSMEYLTSYQIKHGEIKVQSRKILASFEIIFGIALVFTSFLLSFAIVKERRKLMLPYVVGLLLYEVFDLLSLFFYLGKGVQMDPSLWIPDTVILCINMYCVLTIVSLYKDMTKKERWSLIHQMDSTEYTD